MTVAITRLELSASELREASARTKEAKVARRMLAIGLVLDDWSREAASEACGIVARHERWLVSDTQMAGRCA